ncbi:putative C6 transcription factor, partial [Cadophora sp. DSE1049]
MAKLKNTKPSNKGSTSQQPTAQTTLLEIKEKNLELWYNLKVLLYDLTNLKNDPASMTRLERTVHELYISSPYFTTDEAEMIKNALVPVCHDSEDNEEGTMEDTDDASKEVEFETVQQAIQRRMAHFYDKRKANGDFRPCGPHDMVPVYLEVFGIEKGEIGDERVLGRVRR